jgi:hypothetical protein
MQGVGYCDVITQRPKRDLLGLDALQTKKRVFSYWLWRVTDLGKETVKTI